MIKARPPVPRVDQAPPAGFTVAQPRPQAGLLHGGVKAPRAVHPIGVMRCERRRPDTAWTAPEGLSTELTQEEEK